MRKFLLLAFTLFCSSVFGQTPRSAITKGTVLIAGKKIEYKASVQEILFPDASEPAGSVITTTYEKENQDSTHPVIFFFNGGPGASSSPLHLYAFGPVRLIKRPDTTLSVNNENSLLNVADLVFIDPLGTGFTRVYNENKAGSYWDVSGDAGEVLAIINGWREQHHRNHSPFFICGESYGTIRASKIAALADKLPLKGILLLSPVLDFSIVAPVTGNEMPWILQLPSMAAVAWYHHKSIASVKSSQQAFNDAIQFANRTYLNALFKGNSISGAEKNNVGKQLATLLGLPVQTILEKNLRVTTDDFEMLLLADQHKRIGKLDGQKWALVSNEKKPYSARDDPSLVVNKVMSGDVAGRYFMNQLDFKDTVLYKGMNFDINSKWKWSSMDAYLGYYSVLPDLESALLKDPKLKLLVAGGIYDLATPLYAGRYLLAHSNIASERIRFLEFPTGHSIFESEVELTKLATEIRHFIEQ